MRIIGVAGRDGVDEMQAFVTRHDLDHVEHIADVDGAVWSRFGVVGQPSWIFVDGQTLQTTRDFGQLGEDGLADRMRALEGG